MTSKPTFITPILDADPVILNTHKLSVPEDKGVGGKKTLLVLNMNQPMDRWLILIPKEMTSSNLKNMMEFNP